MATNGVVNDYLLAHRKVGEEEFWLAPRITCADGFSVSVQAHAGAYCSPRDGYGPEWLTVELGFPNAEPNAEIMSYAEDASDPTETVYGYVPVTAVDRLIAEHGGIAEKSK
jgi:hypothetical protein